MDVSRETGSARGPSLDQRTLPRSEPGLVGSCCRVSLNERNRSSDIRRPRSTGNAIASDGGASRGLMTCPWGSCIPGHRQHSTGLLPSVAQYSWERVSRETICPTRCAPDGSLAATGGDTSAPVRPRSHCNATPLRSSERITPHLPQYLTLHVKLRFHVERSPGSVYCQIGSRRDSTLQTSHPR